MTQHAGGERRAVVRHGCRIRCELKRGPSWEPGIRSNVSLAGLGVQSPFEPDEGELLQVRIAAPGRPRIQLRGLVWRVRAARRHAKESWSLGLVIETAGSDYLELVDSLATARTPPSRRTPRPAVSVAVRASRVKLTKLETRWYRARVKHRSGGNCRLFSVAGTSEEQARRCALAEIGDDWEVLELKAT